MNNKKGISLIVLVITILVMIILAGVVIVSLQNDNPINKAKLAKMVDSVQSVRAAISQYAVNAQADVGLGDVTVETKMGYILTGNGDHVALKKATDKVDNSADTKYHGKTVKDLLGVDHTSLSTYGAFEVNSKTGTSVFELNEAGVALAGEEATKYPDGIVNNK